eukprot:6194551-Pleurochrysis_carterae.AAC.3
MERTLSPVCRTTARARNRDNLTTQECTHVGMNCPTCIYAQQRSSAAAQQRTWPQWQAHCMKLYIQK